jgi:hypothetical protein
MAIIKCSGEREEGMSRVAARDQRVRSTRALPSLPSPCLFSLVILFAGQGVFRTFVEPLTRSGASLSEVW